MKWKLLLSSASRYTHSVCNLFRCCIQPFCENNTKEEGIHWEFPISNPTLFPLLALHSFSTLVSQIPLRFFFLPYLFERLKKKGRETDKAILWVTLQTHAMAGIMLQVKPKTRNSTKRSWPLPPRLALAGSCSEEPELGPTLRQCEMWVPRPPAHSLLWELDELYGSQPLEEHLAWAQIPSSEYSDVKHRLQVHIFCSNLPSLHYLKKNFSLLLLFSMTLFCNYRASSLFHRLLPPIPHSSPFSPVLLQ